MFYDLQKAFFTRIFAMKFILKMATHTFVVSDENVVNSYGSRVMTAGIDISQYKRNPIVLWYHKRPKQWDDQNHANKEALPIGKAVKLWKDKDSGQLLADIEFDTEDEFAQTIYGKVSRGFINMCSPGLDPVTVSDDAKFLLPGQQRFTLVKSILDEISIVDIGSNNNALRLSHDPGQKIDDILPLVNQSNQNQNTMNEFKTRVASVLGLDPNASEDAVIAAVEGKVNLAKGEGSWKTKFEGLKTELDSINEKAITKKVNDNIDRKFTADKSEFYLNLGKQSGLETLTNVIGNMQDIVKPGDFINPSNRQGKKEEGYNTLTFAKLKEQGLAAVEKLKKENPTEYIRLFKAEYDVEPEMDEKE